MKAIRITDDLRTALRVCHDAAAAFTPGCDSFAVIELPKLALADTVLAAVAAQEGRTTERVARLSALPKARPVAVVEVALRPKRRRRA